MMEGDEGGKLNDNDFVIYELSESDGKRHSALHVPRNLPSQYVSECTPKDEDIFNIFMGDVSGSMCTYFPQVVIGWNEGIKDKLTGTTKIYVFGSEVTFIREGTELTNKDNLGGGTDLTAALRKVREAVESCSQTNVRVFVVTDGSHGHGDPYPETEISQMIPPAGKTVSVYLLGIGRGFPVSYSIDMRSNLHNGNANMPALFWAQEQGDIVEQMLSIGEELNSALLKVTLNVEGCLLPGLDKISSVNVGEWLYFDQPPEELPTLSVIVNEESPKSIEAIQKKVSVRHLLDHLFRQWNSLLIQQHRKKAHVPRENFALMASLFNYHLDIIKAASPTGHDVKSRLTRKNMKSCEVEYQTLMNQSKSVIEIEGKFRDELELADIILKSTVSNRKYDTKNLKLKGHGQEDYQQDLVDFKKIYEKRKERIMALPAPIPEECCRVTITSTVGDLQDADFPLLLEETKFDLLKTLTMTGIPIYAPVRDSSQINPWTLVVKHVLVNPFTILCQQVLEQSAAADETSMGVVDKDVILQKDNENTRFNAIVPLIPASACEVMKPIVLSNIYAMMSTFCILKNPHIIDYSAHIAGLACVWIRTIREFPNSNRPEFVSDRLGSIVATANLYMGRPSLTRYIEVLINSPKQALMTESSELYDGKTLKCESLVKPTFFMYLQKEKFTQQQTICVLELLLYEFIGRCLSSYKVDESEATPYTDFFCAQLSDKKERSAWLAKHCKAITDQTSQGNLLEKFYTPDNLIPGLRLFVREKVSALSEQISSEVTVAIDMKRVKQLRHFSSCGDIRWKSFEALAEEMGLPKEKIEEIFRPNKVAAYVHQALQVRSSRDRLSKDLPSPDDIQDIVTKKVVHENSRSLRGIIFKQVEEFAVKEWKDAYKTVHSPLVMPMTRKQVIEAAQAKGIQVTEENFLKVYKRYNEQLGLLRNACQIPGCPHFLQPKNNFNQHVSIEREVEDFPHALHLVSREFCKQGIDTVVSEVVSGKHAGTKKRKLPPPPAPSTLDQLSTELKSLVIHYASG